MTHLECNADSAPQANPLCLTDPCRASNFELLALPLFDSVHSFARSLARNSAEAEDLVQEAYLKAWRGFATFEPGTNFKAWIFRILKNAFLSSRASAHCRWQAFQVDLDDMLGELRSAGAAPVEILINQDLYSLVQSALESLPVSLQEVIVLCDLQEKSYRETAEELAIPIGTVMSRLSRARKALREAIREMSSAEGYTYAASSRN